MFGKHYEESTIWRHFDQRFSFNGGYLMIMMKLQAFGKCTLVFEIVYVVSIDKAVIHKTSTAVACEKEIANGMIATDTKSFFNVYWKIIGTIDNFDKIICDHIQMICKGRFK